MNPAVLTVNAGSSSIKLAVYKISDGEIQKDAAIHGGVSGLGTNPIMRLSIHEKGQDVFSKKLDRAIDHTEATDHLFDAVRNLLGDIKLLGVGHRVVHGGLNFAAPSILTPEAIDDLAKLTPLAPGHQPINLAVVKKAQTYWPDISQIACFDTSFHRTQPLPATQFALPRKMHGEGVIRYGFHGLSYEYIARAAPTICGDMACERMVVAHLGAGASMCAIHCGKSVATTMGFTALDGLPMGTRCGDLDPGVVLYLLQEKNMSADHISDMLYNGSGLLGMSEISSDMRILEASEDRRAKEAIAYFVYRAVCEIGSLAAALGGLDALIFTAGIGENSTKVRADILAGLGWLGLTLDETANTSNAALISQEGCTPSAWVIPTNEELMIAEHCYRLVAAE